MSLKIAVIYKDGEVYVEFTPEVFEELLISYTQKYGSVKKALDQIKLELKNKTRYR